MEYHERLRDFFKDQGIKQKQVAEMLGYGSAAISKYFNGQYEINAEFIIKLIDKYPDFDLNYLFKGGNVDMVQEPSEKYGKKQEDLLSELEELVKKYKKQ